PLKVIKKLESIRCRFFWGFKDGDEGKWKWSFLIEGDALWRKVIKSFYGEDGGFNDSLRDGKKRWAHTNGVWRGVWMWRIPPCGRSLDDVSSLCSLISDLSLSSEGFDKWQWALDASGVLNVKTLSNLIQDKLLADGNLGNHHTWNSWVPNKVNVCVWRASLDRLPSRVNLVNKGVNLVSKLCPFCELEDETLKHCLIKCSHVQTLWRKGDLALEKISGQPPFPDFFIAAKSDDVFFPSIQRLSLLWISRRCHLKTVSWEL
ncbi:RNA-directed DNA polymerase, eukaryota, reverse transcriptase zinc-binding domain protein, partial [Tanacetum coccineum]